MSQQDLSNFSAISRLFGNLFYRAPNDPILEPVFHWLQQQGLTQLWPLSTDKQSEQALAALQMKLDPEILTAEYQKLFANEPDSTAKVDLSISTYDIDSHEFMLFRQERAMPEVNNVDNFALLLLSASWIEDNLDSAEAQQVLFSQFLLPCAAKFLAKVEQQASLPFYKALALLTREILAAMADELDEETC